MLAYLWSNWATAMSKLLSLTICLLHRDEGLSLSVLPNNTKRKIFRLFLHAISFVLSARQNAVNTVFDFFRMTRRGSRTQVCQLRRDTQATISPCWLVFKIKNLNKRACIILPAVMR